MAFGAGGRPQSRPHCVIWRLGIQLLQPQKKKAHSTFIQEKWGKSHQGFCRRLPKGVFSVFNSMQHSLSVNYPALILTIFGQPFVKQFDLCYHTVVCLSVCLSCPALPACLSCQTVTLVYSGQTVGWPIKMKLGTQVGTGHNVLGGDPRTPLQICTTTQFSAHICCGHMAGW